MKQTIKLDNHVLAGRLLFFLENSELNTEDVLSYESNESFENKGFDSLSKLDLDFFVKRPSLSCDIETLNEVRNLILNLVGLHYEKQYDSETDQTEGIMTVSPDGSPLKIPAMSVNLKTLDQIVIYIFNHLKINELPEQQQSVIDQAITKQKESDPNA